ncbi:MAG TPA: hypothetical protein VFE30_13665 [Anaeromyxobacteraceae bacterium]|nr:hypothetical protein [Anaeromyxobacteraceae bacterium]
MSGSIVVGKSAEEYFRELVSEALATRKLKVREETEFYLVHLLARFLDREELFTETPGGGAEAEPLALILMRALAADRARRYQGLKRLGDTSLFVSGFFGDSLSRAAVDVSYYIAMGGRAYGALGGGAVAPAGMAGLYAELSERFEQFVDLYAEIAELSELSSNRGLVRLYERFLLTGSRRVARRLEERGVALFAGPTRPRRGDVH